MKNRNPSFTLTVLSAALLATYGSAVPAAETTDAAGTSAPAASSTSQPEADQDTEVDEEIDRLVSPTSSIEMGIGHWSGEREQFGIYDNLRGDDTFMLLDADIRYRDDETGTWMTGKIRDLGIDNRDIELRYERQGAWGFGFNYDQLPRIAPYTVNTGMIGLGTESQSVPDSGSGYEPGTGEDVVLGTERKGTGLLFYKYLTQELNFKVNYRNEDKTGDRHWGRGGQPEFAAEPIDSTIRQLDALLDYADKELQVSGGYAGSWYENHNSLVTTYRGGGSEYYLSLPMDNEAHQVFVNAGYNFTPTIRGTFRASYTHATQDEHLPTSDIPDLAAPEAPTELDGEINTTMVYLGLSARPLDNLTLVADLRYHDLDEKTPEWLVITGNTLVHSTPLDYETLTGKLEGTYRLPGGYSLIAGVERTDKDRTVPFGSDSDGDGIDDERYVPFREKVDETTYRAQVRKSLSETLNGAISFHHSDRDGSDYSEAIHSEIGINPINIADRDRDKWRLTLDWVPLDNLGLQFNFEDAQDDYGGPGSNPYGLQDGSARLYSLDADLTIAEGWRVTAWASWDETKAEQFNGRWDRQTANHEVDRISNLKDTGKSLGLSIDGQATAKLKVGADLQWTRTKSRYDDTVIPIGENGDPDTGYPDGISPLEDIENKATIFGVYAEYALDKNAQVRFDVIHERWETDDWTWQFSDGSPFTYGTTNDGTTIITDQDQNATFFGVRYRYLFN